MSINVEVESINNNNSSNLSPFLSYNNALEHATTFTAPVEPFPNQMPGVERLSTFNKVYNRSDLYSLEKGKEEKRKEKEIEQN